MVFTRYLCSLLRKEPARHPTCRLSLDSMDIAAPWSRFLSLNFAPYDGIETDGLADMDALDLPIHPRMPIDGLQDADGGGRRHAVIRHALDLEFRPRETRRRAADLQANLVWIHTINPFSLS